ncbi:sigma factor [Clostridium sp. UBA4395]|uniref:sigma factor n=1 Tax=Clostridium sp. UBA4395 TaxID=1946360 RepID=UPI0032169F55
MDTGGNSLRERIFVMDNYAKIQELVTKAKSGEDTALEELLKTFKALISSQAVAISVKGYDLDDLIQVGIIALYKAVHGYDITKVHFPCHIAIAIKNNIEGLIYMGRNTDGKNSVNKLQRS